MSWRVRWDSTQLNAGSVDSGIAAIFPCWRSCATCGLPVPQFVRVGRMDMSLGAECIGADFTEIAQLLWVRMDP